MTQRLLRNARAPTIAARATRRALEGRDQRRSRTDARDIWPLAFADGADLARVQGWTRPDRAPAARAWPALQAQTEVQGHDEFDFRATHSVLLNYPPKKRFSIFSITSFPIFSEFNFISPNLFINLLSSSTTTPIESIAFKESTAAIATSSSG